MTAKTTAFATPALFRSWLAKNHAKAQELLIRCHKVHAAESGITYKQALDEALCFGWIDGVRRPLDADTFSVRFSPRKPRSKWSAVNVARAKLLEAEGRMRAPGLEAFRRRGDGGSKTGYSYESRVRELAPEFLRRLHASAKARVAYASKPPYYRRTTAFWVMSAKREETREARFQRLVRMLEKGETFPLLERGEGRRPLRRPGKS